MSSNASFLYLRLGPGYEPIWDPDAQLSDLDACAQAILTNLNLFQGEWWENLNEGTPMFQEIINQRATPNGQQIMALALAQRIRSTPYVSGVENMQTSFDAKSRKFSFSCIAKTSFGSLNVQFSPGQSASVS